MTVDIKSKCVFSLLQAFAPAFETHLALINKLIQLTRKREKNRRWQQQKIATKFKLHEWVPIASSVTLRFTFLLSKPYGAQCEVFYNRLRLLFLVAFCRPSSHTCQHDRFWTMQTLNFHSQAHKQRQRPEKVQKYQGKLKHSSIFGAVLGGRARVERWERSESSPRFALQLIDLSVLGLRICTRSACVSDQQRLRNRRVNLFLQT